MEELSHECKELLHSLPKEKGWNTSDLCQYQGFWYSSLRLEAILSFQRHFHARDSDLLLVTTPKSGTVWLKALVFSIVNRSHYTKDTHPLLTTMPHELVPFFEYSLYHNNQTPDLSKLESPRLFSTHIPFTSLPGSVKDTDCRIVYLCRDPKDVFVSFWYFANKLKNVVRSPIELEKGFDLFCKGVSPFGPFWEHVLGYWKMSLERPEKVLFLKYEDMKKDTYSQVKKLAGFLGYPFSLKEEGEGVVNDILRLCSFENLSNLDVNKTGELKFIPEAKAENKISFRKGEVGDWINHLTQEMVEQINHITKEKLNNSGLMF